MAEPDPMNMKRAIAAPLLKTSTLGSRQELIDAFTRLLDNEINAHASTTSAGGTTDDLTKLTAALGPYDKLLMEVTLSHVEGEAPAEEKAA